MVNRLLGFITIQRKIEEKLGQLAYIPSKFIEALYVECGTRIPCHTIDICLVEEKQVRGELLKLMKKGEVDTKIEIEKFQLFERINSTFVKCKDVKVHMDDYCNDLDNSDYEYLVKILKDVAQAGKLMYQSIKDMYDNYDTALTTVSKLRKKCDELIEGLFDFKYCRKDDCDYSVEKPEVVVGNSIRSVLQEMDDVGEKVISIIQLFSPRHAQKQKKEKIPLGKRIKQIFTNIKAKRQLKAKNKEFLKKQRIEKRRNK